MSRKVLTTGVLHKNPDVVFIGAELLNLENRPVTVNIKFINSDTNSQIANIDLTVNPNEHLSPQVPVVAFHYEARYTIQHHGKGLIINTYGFNSTGRPVDSSIVLHSELVEVDIDDDDDD